MIIFGIIIGDDEVWKKYYLHSLASTLTMLKKNPKININYMENIFEDFKKEHGLEKIEYEVKNYNYSWLSPKDMKVRTFRDACDLLEPKVYEDFKLLSYTSHSNSYFSKFSNLSSSYFSTLSLHLLYLYKVVNLLEFEQNDNYIQSYERLLDYLNNNNPILI